MTKFDRHALEKKLRQEAQRERAQVPFSPLLHQRLMAGLRQQGLAPERLQLEPRSWFWRAAVPVGIAAAVAVLAWLALQPPAQPPQKIVIQPPPIPTPIIPAPAVPAPTASVTDNVALATDTLDRGKYAYLDRDAQKLFLFVANQLPGLPPQKP